VARVGTSSAVDSGMFAYSASRSGVTRVYSAIISIVTVVVTSKAFSIESDRAINRVARIQSSADDTSARITSDVSVNTSSRSVTRVNGADITIITIGNSSLESSSFGTYFSSASISIIKVDCSEDTSSSRNTGISSARVIVVTYNIGVTTSRRRIARVISALVVVVTGDSSLYTSSCVSTSGSVALISWIARNSSEFASRYSVARVGGTEIVVIAIDIGSDTSRSSAARILSAGIVVIAVYRSRVTSIGVITSSVETFVIRVTCGSDARVGTSSSSSRITSVVCASISLG
jgi:hypothetical protein